MLGQRPFQCIPIVEPQEPMRRRRDEMRMDRRDPMMMDRGRGRGRGRGRPMRMDMGRGRGRGRGGAPGKEKVRTDLTSPPRMNPPALSSSPLTIHYSSRRRVKEPRRKPRSPRRRNRRRARNDSSGKEVWPKIVSLPKTLPHSTFLTHLACRRPLSSFILAVLQPLALTSFDPPHLNQQ